MTAAGSAEHGARSPAYDNLLAQLGLIFVDEATPTTLRAAPDNSLWAEARGTVLAANRAYRGFGVVACQQAILPERTNGSPAELYRLRFSVPAHAGGKQLHVSCDTANAWFVDSSTGEHLGTVPDAGLIEMRIALAGTNGVDRVMWQPTADAAIECSTSAE